MNDITAESGGDSPQSEFAQTDNKIVRLAGMRRAIAQNVTTSLHTSAQVTSFFEADATSILRVREELASGAEEGPIGINALLVAALATSLRAHPLFNAHVSDREVIIYGSVNVGVAIALDESFGLGGGLIVPVIRHADTKTVSAIQAELTDKIERARSKALSPDEVQEGTFTLTNLGSLPGSLMWRGATPVINGDQSAILGVGRIRDAVIVGESGEPAVRAQLPLSLTHDHRLLDGAAAGSFVEHLVSTLSDIDSFRSRPG